MEQEEQNEQKDVFLQFLDKNVKVFLNFSGRIIVYKGILTKIDPSAIIIKDRFTGDVLIQRKDISQILIQREGVER